MHVDMFCKKLQDGEHTLLPWDKLCLYSKQDIKQIGDTIVAAGLINIDVFVHVMAQRELSVLTRDHHTLLKTMVQAFCEYKHHEGMQLVHKRIDIDSLGWMVTQFLKNSSNMDGAWLVEQLRERTQSRNCYLLPKQLALTLGQQGHMDLAMAVVGWVQPTQQPQFFYSLLIDEDAHALDQALANSDFSHQVAHQLNRMMYRLERKKEMKKIFPHCVANMEKRLILGYGYIDSPYSFVLDENEDTLVSHSTLITSAPPLIHSNNTQPRKKM